MRGSLVKVAGVCGWPIHHSLSPLLHTAWLKQAGIRGVYIPFMVKPWEAENAFRTLKKTRIQGVNVTLPLKQLALNAADEITQEAQTIGAANCLYVKNGQLVAHNTDMEGFSRPLIGQRTSDELSRSTAIVFGAGGASRAVIAALLALDVPEIILINRTDEKAATLCAQANLPSLYSMPWGQRQAALARADVIINTTSAGMDNYPALDIHLKNARSSALVYDLVYTPEMTPLLAEARHRGLDRIGGLPMLIEQARPSFTLFFGQEPPELDAASMLRKELNGRSNLKAMRDGDPS